MFVQIEEARTKFALANEDAADDELGEQGAPRR